MKKRHLDTNFTDDRGSIKDILIGQTVDAVTIITFTAGAVRANHYHKETTQWNYVLSGSLEAGIRDVTGKIRTLLLETGDIVVSYPHEAHAFKALEEATLLVLTQGPRAGTEYESDTFRLDNPIF
jgi:quercetin dioxygenase-like cupin family protein